MTPPRVAEWLLRHITPSHDREFLMSDLREEFDRISSDRGRRAAVRWYWHQALSSVAPLSGQRADRRIRQVRQLQLSRTAFSADLSQSIRWVRRHPLTSFIVVTTLGIAFATALATFTIIDAVLLRALPFPAPDRIVSIRVTGPTLSRQVRSTSNPNFEDWRDRVKSFAAFGAHAPLEFRLTGRGEPREVTAARVTPGFDRIFGLKPLIGRFFTSEDFARGAGHVVVVTHEFWRTQLGRSPSAIGEVVELDGTGYEVVGILPNLGMTIPQGREFWVPLILREGVFWEHARGTGWLSVVGRVRDDVEVGQAEADLTEVARALAAQYPATNRYATQAELLPLQSELVGPIAPMMKLLGSALGAVLLIACANIGNLLLASATRRRREFAVRTAMGAGGARLVRQIAGEATLMCGLAAIVAALASPLVVRAFLAWYPTPLPRPVPDDFSIWLLLPAAVLAFCATAVLTVPQALHLRRLNLRTDIGGSPRTTVGPGERAGRAVLVAVQVTLSFVLIAAGVGFVRTLQTLHEVDTGYRADDVLVFNLSPPPSAASGAAATQFYDNVIGNIIELPGVRAAGAAVAVPMTSRGWAFGIRPSTATSDVLVGVNLATSGYFDALGIRLREGRLFTAEEQRKGTGVALINEPLARLLGGHVVGQKFKYSNTDWEIIGVIDGVRHMRPRDEPEPELIIPWHMAGKRPQAIVVRTDGDPLTHLPAIKARIHALDATAPLSNVACLEDRVRNAVAAERFRAALLVALAAVAIALAALGAYSVTAYNVARRAREYGIRLALGESPASIARRALSTAVIPSLAGITLGCAATFGVAQWIQSFLYRVNAADFRTVAGTAAALLAIALFAGASSARRAARIDPVLTLVAD